VPMTVVFRSLPSQCVSKWRLPLWLWSSYHRCEKIGSSLILALKIVSKCHYWGSRVTCQGLANKKIGNPSNPRFFNSNHSIQSSFVVFGKVLYAAISPTQGKSDRFFPAIVYWITGLSRENATRTACSSTSSRILITENGARYAVLIEL